MSRRLGYSVVVAFLLAVLFGAGNLFWTSDQVNIAEQRISSVCHFMGDLSSAPLTNVPGTRHPSKLGVTIVADAWNAYQGLGCMTQVTPPSPMLRHWAGVYDIGLDR